MKLTVLNQGIGVADTQIPEEIFGALRIEIDAADGEVVKLVSEDHVDYAKVQGGVAEFAGSVLTGRINLSLVRASGTVPLGRFICIPHGDSITLYHDAEELFSRIARVERDISDVHTMYRDIDAKYEDITKRLNRLFTGYDFN